MPQIVQQGAINLAALNVPDLIVQIIPPQLLINGVPSNIVGFVGTAPWGPTNVPTIVGGYQGYVAQFGNPQPRKYDIGTAIFAATQQGAQAFRCVRVTDGTDTAAALVLQANCMTVTSLYTGSLGNSINFTIGTGSFNNTFRAVVAMGSTVPEVFDNVSQGVTAFTITNAGTYTQAPTLLNITAPNMPNGVQAVASPILSVTGTPTVTAPGTGYVVNDTITLTNGVVLKVLSVTTGGVTTLSVLNTGSVLAGQLTPTNPVAQVSTSGSGINSTFTLAWGLGVPVVQTSGSGYFNTSLTATTTNASAVLTNVSAANIATLVVGMALTGAGIAATATIVSIGTNTVTMSANATATANNITVTATHAVAVVGGTESVLGTLTTTLSYWTNLANALNNGVSGLRGPSLRVSATAGVGTSTPTLAGANLSGGSDGASPANIGVTGAPALVGQDAIPRTGMYAMRSAFISMGVLVDCDDPTTYTTQVAFGSSEGIYMIGVGPVGQSISSAANTIASFGIDSFTFKLMLGDWVYISDPITGAHRLISPQGFVAGFMGNQDPSQTPMNKPMNGIIGTQKSSTGIQYTNADLQALSLAGIDVICNPNPGGNYFGLRLGINTASDLSVNGDNYTRMIYFLARSVARGVGGYVGRLQTPAERQEAQTTLSLFLANLEFLGLIGTADGSASYSVQINDANNPFSLVALGYQNAQVEVTFLSVIRYFIVNLQGGQSVQILAPAGVGAATAISQNPTIG
jgi:uncharacterized protein